MAKNKVPQGIKYSDKRDDYFRKPKTDSHERKDQDSRFKYQVL